MDSRTCTAAVIKIDDLETVRLQLLCSVSERKSRSQYSPPHGSPAASFLLALDGRARAQRHQNREHEN